MSCYRAGGCGPYEQLSCSECPASKPEYANRHSDATKPNPLASAASDTVLKLTKDQKKKAMDTVDKTLHQLSFLRTLIDNETLRTSDIQTHLGLMHYAFNDLNEMLDGGMFLNKQLEQTRADLRQANRTIHELQMLSGEKVTATSLCAALRRYDQLFIAWYILTGFHYASVEIYQSGLRADFSDEIDLNDDERISPLCNKDLGRKAMAFTPYVFDDSWDLSDDTYHKNLLDTDRNRKKFISLIETALPGSIINGFSSHNDRGQYLMRPNAFIPYEALERWSAPLSEKG